MMNIKTFFLSLILTTVMILPFIYVTGTTVCQQSVIHSAYDFSAIDQLLEQQAKEFNGLSLIVSKDGQVLYDNGFEGLDTDTVIPIASASKWLSGGCLMAVIDTTSLSLDTQVSEYLDTFEGKKGEITLRQLFSHTSGLPPSRNSGRDVFDKTITLEESVDIIADFDLIADPGAELWYGGFSMQVAGRIAEIAWLQKNNMSLISGEAWMHLFNETIAQPLEMMHTDYNGLGETTNPRIAGSIQTSAKEYLNFLNMILNNGRFNGKQILTEESISKMLRDQTRNATIMQSPWQEFDSIQPGASETRYGVGCWLEEMNTTSGDGVEISSHGAFGFGPWIDIDQNISGVFSVYYINQKTISTYFDVKRILYQILSEDNQPPFTPQLSGPETGRVNKNQVFALSMVDPDGDDLFYQIDWDDQTPIKWIGPFQNNTSLSITHKWKECSNYIVKVKVKDSSGIESDWVTTTLNISKTRAFPKTMLTSLLHQYFPLIDFTVSQSLLFPRPPGQPDEGPGGSNYIHDSFICNEYGSGSSNFFLFEPSSPKPRSAPVVVFYHRWFDTDIENYKPLIRHLTGNGFIVIWPGYNKVSNDLESGVIQGLNTVVSALNELQQPGHVTPDLTHFGAIGHSFGASIAAAIGAQWNNYDLPPPSFIVLWCPGERGSEFIGDLSHCPKDSYFIQMVAEDDKNKHLSTALHIYENTAHIIDNEIYIVQTDRYGTPDLIADHDSGGTLQGHPNALHFYGYWKIATAVALYTTTGIYGEYLNASAKGLYMGQWSDGTPVNQMAYGIDNVTSMIYKRQPFQNKGYRAQVGLSHDSLGDIL